MDNCSNSVDKSDENMITAIFKLNFDILYNYGNRITKEKQLVEDSIQEVFFRIWKNNIDLSKVTNIKSYLLKALRRQIFNLLELKVNYQLSAGITDSMIIEFSPEDFYILNQTEENIRNKVLITLNKLPDRQREAIYLRFFEDLSYREIAIIMNINVQSAKNSVLRGLDIMKKTLPGVVVLFTHGITG